MAVTNRARGAEKSPAWAARAKLRLAFVPGGPAQAAQLVLGEAWFHDPGILHAACTRYSPSLVDELAAKKINAVVLSWFVGFSKERDAAQRAELAKLLPLLKKKKIRALAAIDCSGAWIESNEAEGPLSPLEPREMDLSDAQWRQRVIEVALEALDAGFEGFDLSGGNASFNKAIRGALQEKAGETPLLFSNCWLRRDLSEVSNLKLRERAESPLSLHNIGPLKLLYEMDGRDKTGASALRDAQFTDRQAALATAEVLACGAALIADNAHLPTLSFADEHAEFFSGDPINSVGVLVNDYDENALADGIVGAAKFLSALASANIQYDVIPARELGNFELRKYRVLSALHLQRLSPETADALRVFATEHGGTVLAGTQTAREQRPEWLSAFSNSGREESALGKGRVIHHASAPGDLGEHDRAASEALIAAIAADLLKHGENPLECAAPKGVVCLLWGKGTRRWVHVLNYSDTPADASISLPGCGGRKLAVFSPDASAPELQIVESGAARAAFVLKNLGAYAVVEVV